MSLDDHRESLRHLSKADLVDLSHLHTKHKPIDRVLTTIAIILNKPITHSSFQSLLSDKSLFNTIISLKPSDFTPEVQEKLKPILEDPNLTETHLKETSIPCYHIFRWIKTLYTHASKPVPEVANEDLDKELEKLDINPVEDEYTIPASLDDLEAENRNERATSLKTESQLAQNLLDDCISECWELGSLKVEKPTERVKKLVKAMCILLGVEETWEKGVEILSNCEKFNNLAKSLDIDKLPRKRVSQVRVLLQDPDLRMNNIELDAPELTKVLMWINTVVNYCYMSSYIESGEVCLSESAEEEAVQQESRIIETFSKLLDEGEACDNLSKEERTRLRELEKMGSMEDF